MRIYSSGHWTSFPGQMTAENTFLTFWGSWLNFSSSTSFSFFWFQLFIPENQMLGSFSIPFLEHFFSLISHLDPCGQQCSPSEQQTAPVSNFWESWKKKGGRKKERNEIEMKNSGKEEMKRNEELAERRKMKWWEARGKKRNKEIEGGHFWKISFKMWKCPPSIFTFWKRFSKNVNEETLIISSSISSSQVRRMQKSRLQKEYCWGLTDDEKNSPG